MPRMLLSAVLAVLVTACSSGGASYAGTGLREVTAANQCIDQCQRRYDSCVSSGNGFASSERCGTGVATQRNARCEKIENPELRKSCQASADYCRNRLPALSCGEDRGRCMSSCGG